MLFYLEVYYDDSILENSFYKLKSSVLSILKF